MGGNLRIVIPLLFFSMAVLAIGNKYTLVNIRGTMLTTPDCTVNGNDNIDVDFGDDVVISRIDGSSYKKTQLIYSLVCTSLAKQGLKITINGTPASFDNALIATDKEGLGIQILLDGVVPIEPGSSISFVYGAAIALWAAPAMQAGANLTASKFSGAATLVFDYQ